jgi:thymidylate kinase
MRKMRLGFKLLRLLPRPDWAFLIDIDAETAFGRKPDLPTVSHNVRRIRLYLDLCKQVGVKVMDGRRSSETIHQEVWALVSPVLPSR